jgi:hypothetical protein
MWNLVSLKNSTQGGVVPLGFPRHLLGAVAPAVGAGALESTATVDLNKTPLPPYNYTLPTISSYAMSGSAMAKLEFGSLGGAEGSSEAFYYICEVAAFTDKVVIQRAADESLILQKWGIGFRIGIKAWSIEAKLTANLGMVAAAAELGSAQTAMEIQVFSGDVSKFAMVAEAVKYLTKFNAETLKNISGLVATLTDVIIKDGADIPPVLVKYSEFSPNMYTPDRIVASNTFAIESLAHGRARSQFDTWRTGGDKRDWVDAMSPGIVQCAYENLGVMDAFSTGTPKQREDAETLRKLGE